MASGRPLTQAASHPGSGETGWRSPRAAASQPAQLSDPFMDLACVLAYYPGAQRHSAELAAAAGLDTARLSEALAPRLYVHRSLGWLWHLARGERPGPAP